jgi:hypothetical protein
VLDAADFAAAGGYHKFSLDFETDVELADCAFRVWTFGKAPLHVDCVELTVER